MPFVKDGRPLLRPRLGNIPEGVEGNQAKLKNAE